MITEFLIGFVLQAILMLGYAGVFLLMLMESTVLPVPSELVMPFAGYLVSNGTFGLMEVIVASLAGSIVGSLISYYVGKSFGRATIVKFGRFFFLNEHHLGIAHKWFEKYGDKTILACRFVPAVRHVISLVAGTAEMNLKKFVLYTAIGAFFWNSVLLVAGIMLQKNWVEITKYAEWLDIAIIIGAVVFTAFLVIRHLKSRR